MMANISRYNQRYIWALQSGFCSSRRPFRPSDRKFTVANLHTVKPLMGRLYHLCDDPVIILAFRAVGGLVISANG
ncbi:hypothetical protein Mp_Vg00810 [Marchantia polymorpha subsp. ruderalis]|uniref:Uncharacterized protein n=1 Tax=Marchantia polymorpha TaxID=3197 RepID=A0A2R6VX46_MARPO|nr:hypothetical protein MARPO_YA0036 [Marchantia polymorpha]BBN20593.1 hypothetical protein Mp_Vg00810 [Marchantia polymorpha subsp. ruderalis]|eukprot:PTQ26170.1 hypothetical protein MARPO_YA0036 [Marchantia polymorpha]